MEKTYEDYLNEVVDQIFERASKLWNWAELAQMSGVAYTTVYRLGTRATKYPQLRTVYLMARALNMDLPKIKQRVRELQHAGE